MSSRRLFSSSISRFRKANARPEVQRQFRGILARRFVRHQVAEVGELGAAGEGGRLDGEPKSRDQDRKPRPPRGVAMHCRTLY
jgi:hypothetical protein